MKSIREGWDALEPAGDRPGGRRNWIGGDSTSTNGKSRHKSVKHEKVEYRL